MKIGKFYWKIFGKKYLAKNIGKYLIDTHKQQYNKIGQNVNTKCFWGVFLHRQVYNTVMYTIVKKQIIERADTSTTENEWKYRYAIDRESAQQYIKDSYEIDLKAINDSNTIYKQGFTIYTKFINENYFLIVYQLDKNTIVLDSMSIE